MLTILGIVYNNPLQLLHWRENHLSGREPRTHVVEAFSKRVEVTSRVLWGSVLGPLLFLMYINDLPEGTESYLNMFAKDAQVMTK